MTNLYRHQYRRDELDQPVGRVPEYGNPGALTNIAPSAPPRSTCAVHEVTWAEGGCWMCPPEVPC